MRRPPHGAERDCPDPTSHRACQPTCVFNVLAIKLGLSCSGFPLSSVGPAFTGSSSHMGKLDVRLDSSLPQVPWI